MLIFSLEWQPRPATVAWANQIAGLPQYADYTAVLLTHDYLQAEQHAEHRRQRRRRLLGARAVGRPDQDDIRISKWFSTAISAATAKDYLASTNNAGNTVEQMFFNTQFETHGRRRLDSTGRVSQRWNDGASSNLFAVATICSGRPRPMQFRVSDSRRCRPCRATTMATMSSMRPTM